MAMISCSLMIWCISLLGTGDYSPLVMTRTRTLTMRFLSSALRSDFIRVQSTRIWSLIIHQSSCQLERQRTMSAGSTLTLRRNCRLASVVRSRRQMRMRAADQDVLGLLLTLLMVSSFTTGNQAVQRLRRWHIVARPKVMIYICARSPSSVSV
jgi:hypothetical protein